MYKYRLLSCWLLIACYGITVAQESRLHAAYDINTSKVIFDWNMISYQGKVTYVLLKSTDKKKWLVVVTDKILRQYTRGDIFDYDEKIPPGDKFYYVLRIIDAGNTTVGLSNTVEINTVTDRGSWVLYPNPVNNILHLAYKGNSFIKGVINVLVQDISGKIVLRFRSASIYTSLQIPVSNMSTGTYLVQVIIRNEIMLRQQFVKQ